MPYLHLPAQAGSDRVLKAMNRGYSAGDYLQAGGAHPRGAARHRAVRRLHRRVPRRDGRRLRGDARARARGGLRQRLLVQVLPPARHARRGHARPDRRGREGRAPASACRPCSPNSRPPSTAPASAGPSPCCSTGPAATPASSSGAAPICRRCTRSHRRRPSARSCRSGSRPPRPTASAACSWARRLRSPLESRAARIRSAIGRRPARGVRPQQPPCRADRGRLPRAGRDPGRRGVARRRRQGARGGQAGGEVDRRKGGPRSRGLGGRRARRRGRRPHRVGAGWRGRRRARPAWRDRSRRRRPRRAIST